ncbi:MAG: AmmeMemoRadiSam system protein B, partial [Fidelibacterota bacterium]
MKSDQIREPVVAGSFYPENSSALADQIDSFFDGVADMEVKGQLVALISPHAGYLYSGQVAAYGYKLLKNVQIKCVVILAPSHREYFMGSTVYDGEAYKTPLGDVDVDQDLAKELTGQNDMIYFSSTGHRAEHSLEVQIPFLQKSLAPGFKILPVVMGDQNWKHINSVGKTLGKVLEGKNSLIVASTDLSHFYSYQTAMQMDNIVIRHVEAFDPEALFRSIENRECEACGAGPMIAAMIASKDLGASTARILKYS